MHIVLSGTYMFDQEIVMMIMIIRVQIKMHFQATPSQQGLSVRHTIMLYGQRSKGTIL